MSQTVHDTTNTAKDKFKEASSEASGRAKEQLDGRTTDAGDQLQDKADNLHAVGDQMRERGDDTFAQVADRVAGWTEDAARYLRDADADRMLGDVESFARRQPWAVAAGGLVLGFMASRVVRAGSERRNESSRSQTTGYGQGYEDLEGRRDVVDVTEPYAPTYAAVPMGSVAPEAPGYESPSTDPVPPHRPVPDSDPLVDPLPDTDRAAGPDWETGGTHVQR